MSLLTSPHPSPSCPLPLALFLVFDMFSLITEYLHLPSVCLKLSLPAGGYGEQRQGEGYSEDQIVASETLGIAHAASARAWPSLWLEEDDEGIGCVAARRLRGGMRTGTARGDGTGTGTGTGTD
ncbi:uncharacterized protein THITE_2106503 [Thermothielavioides terrestris NRRL 8126]|uniref:Uncharacterized protein n=1 Tax=Thermothielavioides terrestris (strain ATCC 38088 / NRRL 8126) TaxID=578455 RepID=G2QQI0_THETT|nr:uncharacterized protein THITE_2106503 [Thermothielavioides terrestris NRRL 8126]AEO62390.1 hypothetical protein THITE_2106503 [Thermothielavioides terrestris NRRL 8126]